MWNELYLYSCYPILLNRQASSVGAFMVIFLHIRYISLPFSVKKYFHFTRLEFLKFSCIFVVLFVENGKRKIKWMLNYKI